MPFTDIRPPQTAATTSGTGIGFSVSESRKGRRVARLTINATVQDELFGGPVLDKRFHAKIGRGQDVGRLLLVQHDEGDLIATKLMRGAVSIRMDVWDTLPNGKFPSQAVEVIGPDMGGFVFLLPKWARVGETVKMEQEFGLKRTRKAG